MNESMIEVIQLLKQSELKAEEQRKELCVVKREIINLKSEIGHLSGKIRQDLKHVYDDDLATLAKHKVESSFLEKNEKQLLIKMLSEINEQIIEEKSMLEKLHSDIWQERRHFCDRVRIFNDQYGLLASTRPRITPYRSVKQEPGQERDEELFNLEREVNIMEANLQKLLLQNSNWKIEEENLKKETEQMSSETFVDPEFLSLEQGLQCHQKLIEKLDFQSTSLQIEIDAQDKLSSLLKTAKSFSTDSLTSNAPTPKNLPKAQMFKTEYTSKKTSILTQRLDRCLLPARQMGYQENVQPSVTTSNKSHKPDITLATKLADNETGACNFQRKTPSEVTLRLMSSKKNSASLERQMNTYFNSKISAVQEIEKLDNLLPLLEGGKQRNMLTYPLPTNNIEKNCVSRNHLNIQQEKLSSTYNPSEIKQFKYRVPKHPSNLTMNVYRQTVVGNASKESQINQAETKKLAYNSSKEVMPSVKVCTRPLIEETKPLKSILKKASSRQPFIA